MRYFRDDKYKIDDILDYLEIPEESYLIEKITNSNFVKKLKVEDL